MDPGAQMDEATALESAVVLQVEENVCRVLGDGAVIDAEYAPQLPSPRVERISPGHRVALAAAHGGRRVVLWRWYDAVVVGFEGECVRLWEPAHGEVVASARAAARGLEPGTRAYLSAGLPGADWWVAGSARSSGRADVELDEVAALYTELGLWDAALAGSQTEHP